MNDTVDSTVLRLTRRQAQGMVLVIATLVGAYLGAWLFLDDNFDTNRAHFRTEAELTRAQVVAQADWIRSELLSVVTACVKED